VAEESSDVHQCGYHEWQIQRKDASLECEDSFFGCYSFKKRSKVRKRSEIAYACTRMFIAAFCCPRMYTEALRVVIFKAVPTV
jgi:hypothetical protein